MAETILGQATPEQEAVPHGSRGGHRTFISNQPGGLAPSRSLQAQKTLRSLGDEI